MAVQHIGCTRRWQRRILCVAARTCLAAGSQHRTSGDASNCLRHVSFPQDRVDLPKLFVPEVSRLVTGVMFLSKYHARGMPQHALDKVRQGR